MRFFPLNRSRAFSLFSLHSYHLTVSKHLVHVRACGQVVGSQEGVLCGTMQK